MDTNARGFWLVKRTLGYKNFVPEELSRNQSILRFDDYTTTRLANRTMSFTYEGFLWRENEESMFSSFHPLADKTSNDHLPKPFIKVTRKSLILQKKGIVRKFWWDVRSFSQEGIFVCCLLLGRTVFHTKILKSGERHRLIKLSVTPLEVEWH